ncbi:GMC family oxidoreductase N-terminal domain-containing protein [Bdellovibrio svalbardensis]|uniref:Cholesterol oxidase n=1 Tax=Bdellovibrio svalbardensis TaxID=2972972 RepID=A0ABT6DL00_9BACT|nr:GMC family oxidoreductase [Bdellovibrio svalbardensis]MDG0816511.1 GMC family oxidoreductase [Bdellovibrio svalbardensis]
MKSHFSRRSFLKSSFGVGILGLLRSQRSQAEPKTRRVDLQMDYSPLANSFVELKSSYEVLIIGSGYGGAVMGARLSRNREVAILERGREWTPGEYPETLQEMKEHIYCESHPLGLFAYHTHREIDVLSGSGLGGTSLINAGVVIPPDRDLFQKTGWPEEISREASRGDFEKYYQKVGKMLNAQAYNPRTMNIAKAENLRQSAEALKSRFSWAKIAVNLHGPHVNPAGDKQPRCHMCGNCVTGCNTGAKNTLNMNYLPLAKRNGAKIFTQMAVSHVERLSNGNYLVRGTYISESGKKEFRIEARNVIVSAGTMGSTQILLRSQKLGNLKFSSQLGKHFSGNGDLLGVGFNGVTPTNMVGNSSAKIYRPEMLAGPTILGIADYRASKNIFERFLIEEGDIPGALVNLLRRLTSLIPFQKTPTKIYRAWLDFIDSKDIEKGALNYSMIYFGMGHDKANGKIVLDSQNRAVVSWPGVMADPIFSRVTQKIKQHVAWNGSTYVKNPRSTLLMGDNLITVHPLGGCAMGSSVDSGVVNHLGQVYGIGGALQEGLFVMDGSVIPTAIGVNPLLTISTLAERSAERISLR